MSADPNSVGKQGQFHSSVPPAKPMMTSGHQLGQQVGNAAVPEFRAQTHAPGTAPKQNTYKPNPIHETPGQALNPDAERAEAGGRTEALDMPGATSGDVHKASTFARPMEGQNQRELHGAHGVGKRKGERSGLEGVGATTATTSDETVEGRTRALGADLPEGVERGIRGKGPGAEETNPASAAEVASEKRRS
ncbi:hypothetical protein C8A00DRAFT_43619 [Chaetomidium leptoderma]|uniref:Uncharacterized protein n=1 Tax=Chaetomidium leptoderma TaxID=669021 RepID=A0AAN6VNE7_9PEZI|nr:hypothetical protein C8A00DRAFT_43619 [Chaetomidium leptoderma]